MSDAKRAWWRVRLSARGVRAPWLSQVVPVVRELLTPNNRRWQLYLAAQSLLMHVAAFTFNIATFMRILDRSGTAAAPAAGNVRHMGAAWLCIWLCAYRCTAALVETERGKPTAGSNGGR